MIRIRIFRILILNLENVIEFWILFFSQAFNLPNVHLISDSVDRLYEKGLVTKTKDQFGNVDEKSYEFDVIILATGKGSFFNYVDKVFFDLPRVDIYEGIPLVL